jgi:cell division control protein 45
VQQPYGLEKLEYTSFNRITGYKSLVSASDMSYAVTGLLESESTDAFHAAFDALNSKVIPSSISSEGYSVSNIVNGGPLASVGIGEGLQRAMLMQKTIVSTAISLIERRAITRLRHFRYAFVTSTRRESKDKFVGSQKGSDQNQHPLCHPLALTRLAHWLMDTHRENGKWTGNKSRPLVLCAENPIQNSYLIVGYEFPDRHGMFLKNHFGQLFRMTCESMKGSFRLDSFDSHVVEVGIDDVQRFIEQLHYMIDSI